MTKRNRRPLPWQHADTLDWYIKLISWQATAQSKFQFKLPASTSFGVDSSRKVQGGTIKESENTSSRHILLTRVGRKYIRY